MRKRTIELYEKTMHHRGWLYARIYPWTTRIKTYPIQTIWYALADRFWASIVRMQNNPFLSVKTFWGQTIKVQLPDYRSVLHHGLIDAEELPVEDYLVLHLTEKDVFFDVGANIGFYSALAYALDVRAVHAFEPTPHTFEILKTNVPGITLINKAVLDREGSVSFKDFGAENSGRNLVMEDGAGTSTVEAITLDAYCKEQGIVPTYMKMDIEHAEFAALRGAQETLRAHHPVLVIETDAVKVIEFLKSLGYVPYYFDYDALGAVRPYRTGVPLSGNMLFLPTAE